MSNPVYPLLVQLALICLLTNAGCSSRIIERPGPATAHVQAGEEAAATVDRHSLKVMTFNILWEGHYGGKFYDSGFSWRKPLVLDVLKKYGADIIGLQEASIEQRATLAPELPEFGMFPVPSGAGDECILYRLDRFDLIAGGQEDLRREPEIVGTNIGVRDFVWVYLQDQVSGRQFYVLNLHLDHRSSERGRQLDGVLTGEWIRKRETADPVILLGDFNGRPNQPRYLYLTAQSSYPDEDGVTVKMPMPMMDTFSAANPRARYAGTSNSSFKGKKNRNQIDYIFIPRGAKVLGSSIIYYHADGSYPSDHFPLISEIGLE